PAGLDALAAAVAAGAAPAGTTAAVRTRFDLGSPAGGPFPSDRFAVFDDTQNTGLRVHLPSPDCAVRVSDCEDLNVLNTLDGFNLQPRLSIPFDGPIDVNSVSGRTVFLLKLANTGGRVGINQVVYDPATTTLH